MRSVYVSGTDTGIGKTRISCALLGSLRAQGVDAVGMKPVASGCESGPAGLRNADAVDLIAAGGRALDYGLVNPYALADPIAPHLAAADNGEVIALARIRLAHQALLEQADFVVVEGVGGWLAPLGDTLMQADIVRGLDLPVLLVVGLRLGCINHALLSARAIEADGCRLLGWIGNRIDPDMLRVEDNIETLRRRIHAPLLGIIDHADNPRADRAQASLADAVRTLLEHPSP